MDIEAKGFVEGNDLGPKRKEVEEKGLARGAQTSSRLKTRGVGRWGSLFPGTFNGSTAQKAVAEGNQLLTQSN